ncbi:MAG: response regulator [Caldilineaceae bacterium]|nr:response regulator [Caldilineaceae bacterium]
MPSSVIDLLLVEDDEVDREAIRRHLTNEYRVHEVATGREALQLCQKLRPDCVLLDYRLPDGEGLSLLPTFLAHFIPVIVTTGVESPEVIVEAMREGAQDYLVKSQITRTSLTHAIHQAIDKVTLMQTVANKNHQLRELASALTLAEQGERQRISQILHDHVQQMLHGIQLRTHLLILDAPPSTHPSLQEHLEAIQELTGDAIQATRTLTVELSPPVLQREGLTAAFRWLAGHMAEMHTLDVDLEIQEGCVLPNNELSMLLFQVTRELLFNVVKHAKVKRARLSLLEQGEMVIVRVTDDGVGFDPANQDRLRRKIGGFGLVNIQDRLNLFGGHVNIISDIGKGTSVTLSVPKVLKVWTE